MNNVTSSCPSCGALHPVGAPQGLCPKCLLQRGLDGSPPPSTPNKTLVISEAAVVSESLPGVSSHLHYFGDYELLEEIARGGMGVVWKARQMKLNRIVAVKMILSGRLAGDAEVKRFRTEAEASAQLQHPNIVAIHEVGEHDGQNYFSMDFVEGQSLAELVFHRPLTPRHAAELLRSIAGAIHYAHEKGVVHRDLKPSNVLIDAEGEPRVTDFGLAKLTESNSGMTHSGAVMGSPSYMSPEQAAGKTREVGPLSDVYSLGAILYELITSRPPFRAATPLDTMKLVVETEPTSPKWVNPEVPADLETICLKCLEKDPHRRYASAQELANELGRFLKHEPIRARPASYLYRAHKWTKRKPAQAALVAVSVVALFILAVGLMRYAATLRQHGADLNDRLHLTLIEQARAERLLGHRETALQRITQAGEIKRTPELRAEAIQVIAQPGLRRIFDAPVGALAVSRFSADGKLLATAGGGFVPQDWPGYATNAWQKFVRIWEVPSGKLLAALPWHLEAGSFALSPDSRLLAVPQLNVEGVGELALWDLHDGKVTARLPVSGPSHFNADGKFLAVQESNRVSVFSLRSTNAPAVLYNSPAAVFAWTSPDQLLLQDLPGEGHGRLFHWSVVTGEKTFPLKDTAWVRKPDRWFPPQPLPGYKTNAFTEDVVAVSPDGRTAATRYLVSRGNPEELFIRDLATGDKLVTLRPTPFPERSLLSAHGRRLVFHDEVEPGRVRVYDVNRDKFLSGVGEPGLDFHLAQPFERFRPGQHSGSGTSGSGNDQIRYSYSFLDRPQSARPSPAIPWAVDVQNFSPDGTLFATEMSGGEYGVALWELNSGRRVASVAGAQRPVWSADGRWLSVTTQGMIPHVGGGSGSGEIAQVLEVLRGVPTHRLPNAPRTIAFSPDGRQLTVADGYASIIWEVEQNGGGMTLHATTNKLTGNEVVVRTNTTWLLNGFWVHKGLSLVQVSQLGSKEKPFSIEDPPLSSGLVCARAVSPDGQRLILSIGVPKYMTNAAVNGPHFQMWDLVARKRVAVWPHPDGAQNWGPAPVVFSPDGRRVASSCFIPNGIEIWDASTGKRLQELHPPLQPPPPVYKRPGFFTRLTGFLPGRSRPPPAVPWEHFSESSVSAIAFTPDSRLVVSCAQGRAVIREVESGRELAQCRLGTNALSVAISPDGRTLAIGSADRSISLWGLPSGHMLARWPAHDAEVKALTFSPDGTTLASGAGDATMKLWNLPFIRRELQRLKLDW